MSAATEAIERPGAVRGVVAVRRLRAVSTAAGYALGLGAAAWIVVISVSRGRALQRAHREVMLGAAPFVGRDPADGWDWRFGAALVGAGVIAAVVVAAVWTGWFARARLRTIALSSAAAAAGFALLLALTDRADGVLNGARHPTEYLSNLPKTPPAGEFVRRFLDDLDKYSVHLRGHPPGFILVLKAMAAIGLDGAWPVALLSVVAAAAVVGAVLTTVWAVAGAAWVRRTAPFLILTPYALWQVTSADAVYAAVGAVAVAALAVGLRLQPWRALATGLVAGLLLGSLCYLTYLGVIFALVPALFLTDAALRRRQAAWRVMAGAVVGGLVVIISFRLAGFWWIDGARRTRTEYWEGTAQFRDWDYFKYANIAVLLVAIGPAAVFGLMRLRDRRMWLLCGGAVAAVAASHLSQYTRGEVERIWLLFFPWLVLAAAAATAAAARRWASVFVGLQAATAIALQAALVSKW
jgi:hypothetical protein